MQKTLITGASGGIGLELARLMAAKGHSLVLVARGSDKLAQVKKNIIAEFGVSVATITQDLAAEGSAKALYDKAKKHDVEILVNNAGVGLKGDFFSDSLLANQQMAHLNMTSLMELTHLFGNAFIKKGSGRILNVASIVAFLPGPNQPVYYATKAFVRSLSRALAYNLQGSGVTVTTLHPGVTKTDFFVAAGAPTFKRGASPRAVAKTGYDAMMAGKVEVTHGGLNKFLTNVLVRFIPYRWQAAMIDKSSDL